MIRSSGSTYVVVPTVRQRPRQGQQDRRGGPEAPAGHPGRRGRRRLLGRHRAQVLVRQAGLDAPGTPAVHVPVLHERRGVHFLPRGYRRD